MSNFKMFGYKPVSKRVETLFILFNMPDQGHVKIEPASVQRVSKREIRSVLSFHRASLRPKMIRMRKSTNFQPWSTIG